MVINLDSFKRTEYGLHDIWSNGKGSYVVTDKKGTPIDAIYIGDKGVSKADIVRILIAEYGEGDTANKLKRIIGEPVIRKSASGEA